MRLFHIKTRFIAKDLDKVVSIGYIVAESDEQVFDFIDRKYRHSGWKESSRSLSREEIMRAKGDFNDEFLGEFYDQKFSWQEVGEVTENELSTLVRLGMILDRTAKN